MRLQDGEVDMECHDIDRWMRLGPTAFEGLCWNFAWSGHLLLKLVFILGAWLIVMRLDLMFVYC